MDKKGEMERVARIFDEYGLPQTATIVRSLIENLYGKKASVDFKMAFKEIRNKFREEFIAGRDTDPSFKKSIYQAFETLAVSASRKNRALVEKMVKDFEPSMKRILNSYTVIGDVGKSFTQNPQLTYKQKYYGACFAYVMIVEGVFREICEYILMLDDIRTGKSRTFNQINALSIYDLVQQIRSQSDISILTKGYFNRLRNAIAHANFRLDETTGKMNFKDVHQGVERDVGDFTLEEFGKNYYLKIDDLYTLISSFWILGKLVDVYHDC